MNRLFKSIIDFFSSPDKKIITRESIDKRIAEDYEYFQQYGIREGQVYLIRLGLFSEEINNYLAEHKDIIKDYFPVESGDYIQVLGIVTPQQEKFTLFVVYKYNYDKKVGNFLSVEKWPPFQNYEKKIEGFSLGSIQ